MSTQDSPLFELAVTDGVTLRVTDPSLAGELPRLAEVAAEHGEPDLASVIEAAIADYVARVSTSAFNPAVEGPVDEPPTASGAAGL